MIKYSLITTVKNRLNHFLQTFPSAISQRGVEYELVYVNFHSNDVLSSSTAPLASSSLADFIPTFPILYFA